MKGMYTGLGMIFGAGIGMIVGLLFLETWWHGMGIGTAAGLMLGAVVEMSIRDKESAGSV